MRKLSVAVPMSLCFCFLVAEGDGSGYKTGALYRFGAELDV